MPEAKKFEPGSRFAIYDLDHDGTISDEEMARAKEMLEMELREEKAEAQKRMAWFSRLGMLLYPTLIVVCTMVGLDMAAGILGDIASVYFVAIAGLVGAFFGAQAFMARK